LLKDSARLALSGSNVRCEYSLPEGLWFAEIDEDQIRQVIHNVVLNADQTMPEGGTIEIRAENVRVTPADVLPLEGGRYVIVSVQDQGTGIPEKYLEKIFDPFFTTKEKGSGLGLSISHSIINRHGGTIRVESRMGVGTTFHIYLPASEGQEGTEERERGNVLRGEGRILVVDDEEAVRRSAGKLLKKLGYDVECSKEGREGIRRYVKARNSGRPFRAVIMDLTIPGGLGGREAVRELKKADPEAVVIVSSGYSDDPVLSHYGDHGFSGVVTKPYTVEELGEAIYRLFPAG
jgi:two-component system, cell cycle sensor histidine kinase and response regulator CckA